MAAMLGAYTALYDGLCARKAPARLRPNVNFNFSETMTACAE